MNKNKSEDILVEIWDDVVDIVSLVKSLLITSFFTMGSYFIAPSQHRPSQLLFGLLGAVLGFIISSLLFKPKRHITIKEQNNER